MVTQATKFIWLNSLHTYSISMYFWKQNYKICNLLNKGTITVSYKCYISYWFQFHCTVKQQDRGIPSAKSHSTKEPTNSMFLENFFRLLWEYFLEFQNHLVVYFEEKHWSLPHHAFCASAHYSSQNDRLVAALKLKAFPLPGTSFSFLLPCLHWSYHLKINSGIASSRNCLDCSIWVRYSSHGFTKHPVLSREFIKLGNGLFACYCTPKPKLDCMVLQARYGLQTNGT